MIKSLDMVSSVIRFKGVWDMEDLYESMVDWFRRRKYKFHEKIYKHKHPSPFGIERQYIWQAVREVDEYMSFIIDIYFHTYDAHEIDVVMADGSKNLFTKGRIWMEFTGKVDLDIERRFNESKFYYHLKDFFHKYVWKKKFQQVIWDVLWYREISKLRQLVKQRLKTENLAYEHRYWTGVHG